MILIGSPEPGPIIEVDPSLGQVVRLCDRAAVEHDARIAHRDDVVFPTLGMFLDLGDQGAAA